MSSPLLDFLRQSVQEIPGAYMLPQSPREEMEWFMRVASSMLAEKETITPEEFTEVLRLLPSVTPSLLHPRIKDGMMAFSDAMDAMLLGHRVAREGWDGEYLVFVPGSDITVEEERPLAAVFPPGTRVYYASHVDRVRAGNNVVVYHPELGDLLQNDWVVL